MIAMYKNTKQEISRRRVEYALEKSKYFEILRNDEPAKKTLEAVLHRFKDSKSSRVLLSRSVAIGVLAALEVLNARIRKLQCAIASLFAQVEEMCTQIHGLETENKLMNWEKDLMMNPDKIEDLCQVSKEVHFPLKSAVKKFQQKSFATETAIKIWTEIVVEKREVVFALLEELIGQLETFVTMSTKKRHIMNFTTGGAAFATAGGVGIIGTIGVLTAGVGLAVALVGSAKEELQQLKE